MTVTIEKMEREGRLGRFADDGQLSVRQQFDIPRGYPVRAGIKLGKKLIASSEEGHGVPVLTRASLVALSRGIKVRTLIIENNKAEIVWKQQHLSM